MYKILRLQLEIYCTLHTYVYLATVPLRKTLEKSQYNVPCHRSCADPYGSIKYLYRKPRENSSLAKNPSKYTTAYIVL
jgi:hypothetical protein